MMSMKALMNAANNLSHWLRANLDKFDMRKVRVLVVFDDPDDMYQAKDALAASREVQHMLPNPLMATRGEFEVMGVRMEFVAMPERSIPSEHDTFGYVERFKR